MSAAGTLSVQQQACARPTLIFVVGWFLPEVREFLFMFMFTCAYFFSSITPTRRCFPFLFMFSFSFPAI